MGVLITDKQSNYDNDFSAIITPVSSPLSVSYFGKSGITDSLRLGEFNSTGRKGTFTPLGTGAVLSSVGISTLAEGSTSNANRFQSSQANTTSSATIIVVGDFSNAQAFSFAGVRMSLDGERKFRIRDASGVNRAGGKVMPTGPCLLFLNSSGLVMEFGTVSSLGVMNKESLTLSSGSFTASSTNNYLGGTGHVSNVMGPTTFYSQCMFDRNLTESEIKSQSAQLIAYANSLGVVIA